MTTTIRRILYAVGWGLKAIGWTIAGVVAYFICQGMLGGYPRFHSQQLTTIGMILIAVTGGLAWIMDERRDHGDQ